MCVIVHLTTYMKIVLVASGTIFEMVLFLAILILVQQVPVYVQVMMLTMV